MRKPPTCRGNLTRRVGLADAPARAPAQCSVYGNPRYTEAIVHTRSRPYSGVSDQDAPDLPWIAVTLPFAGAYVTVLRAPSTRG